MVKSASRPPLSIVKPVKPDKTPPATNGEPLDAETFHAHIGFMTQMKGRKMASAMIAKIPLPLSRHIAATFRPEN